MIIMIIIIIIIVIIIIIIIIIIIAKNEKKTFTLLILFSNCLENSLRQLTERGGGWEESTTLFQNTLKVRLSLSKKNRLFASLKTLSKSWTMLFISS